MSLWAEEKKVDDMEDFTKPITEAIQEAIRLGDNVNEVGIKWNGPRLKSLWFRAVTPQPEFQLQPKQLKYHAKNGRDVFAVIALISVQFGIEQGIKIYEEDYLEQEILARRIDKRHEEKKKNA